MKSIAAKKVNIDNSGWLGCGECSRESCTCPDEDIIRVNKALKFIVRLDGRSPTEDFLFHDIDFCCKDKIKVFIAEGVLFQCKHCGEYSTRNLTAQKYFDLGSIEGTDDICMECYAKQYTDRTFDFGVKIIQGQGINSKNADGDMEEGNVQWG